MTKIQKITSSAKLIATCTLALFAISGVAAAAGKRIVHEFTGGTDGNSPTLAGLITDGKNNYYGVTAGGGNTNCELGCGTVYRLSKNEVRTLYAFTGGNDGYRPGGRLLRYNREFYGVTAAGGENDLGTIYKLSHDGTHTVLYSFVGGTEGANPGGTLVADGDGNLYGVAGGGIGNCIGGPCGTVYKLAPDGVYTLLHAFDPLKGEGTLPSGLVADTEGNFYGTTTYGGTGSGDQCAPYGCGTVYKITPQGVITFIRNFVGLTNDGSTPQGGLTIDANNNLYGTTYEGGGFEDGTGLGTVYKLTTSGEFTILHSFNCEGGDGCLPYTGVSVDAQGNLYGTTYYGGDNSDGVIYKVTPDGQETALYSFDSDVDGAFPGIPLSASANTVIGTTATGGVSDAGTIYQLRY
jgi:uncharacterized repeat protein (TIGR03803 family)